MPSLSNKSRETGEIQDMYRRNLAAYWTAQPGELRADECIENIFAGGDGWAPPKVGGNGNGSSSGQDTAAAGDQTPPRRTRSTRHGSKDGDSGAGGDGSGVKWSRRKGWFGGDKVRDHPKDAHGEGAGHRGRDERGGDARGGARGGSIGRSGLEVQADKMHQGDHARATEEVDEFTVREDLRSWRVGEAA